MKIVLWTLKILMTASIVFLGTAALAQTPLKRTTTPLPAGSSRTITKPLPSVVEPAPIQQLEFDSYRSGDVKMSPATLTIKYGSRILSISQGQRKVLSIDEDSPLLDSNSNLQATVEYRLENKTTKTLKFRVGVRYGNSIVTNTEVTFYGKQTKNIRANIKLAPSSDYLPIQVKGLNILDYPDDNPPVFLNGGLKVFVYPN